MSEEKKEVGGGAAAAPIYKQGASIDCDDGFSDDEIVDGEVVDVLSKQPLMNIKKYIQPFTGYGRLLRLKYIIDKFLIDQHVDMLPETYRMLIDDLQKGNNTEMYIKVCVSQEVARQFNTYDDHFVIPIDEEWLKSTRDQADDLLKSLRLQYSAAKKANNRVELYNSYKELGAHYFDCGRLSESFKRYESAMMICDDPKELIRAYINLLKVSIYLKKWPVVREITYKLNIEFDKKFNVPEDAETIRQLIQCANGLVMLETEKFRAAALLFMEVDFDNCKLPDIISRSNIAAYVGICVLAEYSRPEQKAAMDSSKFFQFFQQEPKIRLLLEHFYNAKYKEFIELFQQVYYNLSLDPYIGGHMQKLKVLIYRCAIIQYVKPYSRVSMVTMAQIFNFELIEMQNILEEMIKTDQIDMRIDTQNSMLVARVHNRRAELLTQVITQGKQFRRQASRMIIYTAMLKAGICFVPQSKDVTPDELPPGPSDIN